MKNTLYFRNNLRIGTRGSPLALWQSNWIKSQLEEEHGGLVVELVKIKTSGDKIQDVPLAKVGGKGLFTKEIEESLLRSETDLAVHSMKDVPMDLPTALTISVVTEREDPRDALISKNNLGLEKLPKGARVGTGSFRRTTQLLHFRPDLEVIPLRGNVETRLKKMDTENLDAVILAAAGLIRLGKQELITEYISPKIMLPGGGQGAVGIETRRGDMGAMNMLFPLDHEETHLALDAERGFLKRLEGGCQVPIGVYATVEGMDLEIDGLVGSLDGKTIIRSQKKGSTVDPGKIGKELAEELLSRGADKILNEVYGRDGL